MKIRLHQSDEVLGTNVIALISSTSGRIDLDIFMSKYAVKSLTKRNDIILEV